MSLFLIVLAIILFIAGLFLLLNYDFVRALLSTLTVLSEPSPLETDGIRKDLKVKLNVDKTKRWIGVLLIITGIVFWVGVIVIF